MKVWNDKSQSWEWQETNNLETFLGCFVVAVLLGVIFSVSLFFAIVFVLWLF